MLVESRLGWFGRLMMMLAVDVLIACRVDLILRGVRDDWPFVLLNAFEKGLLDFGVMDAVVFHVLLWWLWVVVVAHCHFLRLVA